MSFNVFSLTLYQSYSVILQQIDIPLRKVRDSNPRATEPPNDLANRPLQPLE